MGGSSFEDEEGASVDDRAEAREVHPNEEELIDLLSDVRRVEDLEDSKIALCGPAPLSVVIGKVTAPRAAPLPLRDADATVSIRNVQLVAGVEDDASTKQTL
ncbi:hypothetical protein B0H15DRAFT_949391 [Mycena belliarum]|uniref:Uncharacterized protein n=1 Tax=Mycena belliarum TaxID=1033014 RepID=A0AAD6U4X2_9AGAR|nr:hypothetical protein B0H15DRAFT_949391 [Mycena belliae]